MELKREKGKEYILSFSYGKDSMACLGAIEELGWPLDRIVHAEVWATNDIPAELPPMVEFKAKADRIIKKRWGIEVEHYRGPVTYEEGFYLERGRTGKKTKFSGRICGFPMRRGQWCLQQLKMPAIRAAIRATQRAGKGNVIQYIGIAIDEPNRFNNLSNTKLSPLVEMGWDEAYCRRWCEENGLLSPIYAMSTRGGCWFCHNQSINQFRILRKQYPEYWNMMLRWDIDSPTTFRADGHTVCDYEARFEAEDKGLVPIGKSFRWSMLDDVSDKLDGTWDMLEKLFQIERK